jgi:hypothetical protein
LRTPSPQTGAHVQSAVHAPWHANRSLPSHCSLAASTIPSPHRIVGHDVPFAKVSASPIVPSARIMCSIRI